MSATAEEITDGFLEFDIEINDEDVMMKLLEIAALFSLDADNLVNEWLAYQSRHQHQSLSFPELEKLEQILSSTRGKSHSKKSLDDSYISDELSGPNGMDILENYCSPGNVGKLRKMQVETPIKYDRKRKLDALSPSIFSPLSASKSKSQNYSSRSNSGEIVAYLSEGEITDAGFWLSSVEKHSAIVKGHQTETKEGYKYMFQKIIDICDVLNDCVETYADDIKQQYGDDIVSFAPCSAPSQSEVCVIGRIKSESLSKLTPLSILLEGDRVNSFGRSVSIELEKLSEYSFFPGQTVAMRGVNPTGSKFVASRIFSDAFSKGKLSLASSASFIDSEMKLRILIAAGPFSTSDSFNYDPLLDLIKVIKQSRPDVTVLIGPIVDADHKDIQNSCIDFPILDYGKNWINFIQNELEGFTEIVFIPSLRDAFHHPVYPQPPYTYRSTEKCHFLGNPSSFSASEICIGTTSVDILMHLVAEEISKCQSGLSSDRLARLTKHLFTQKSFYPLYPPHESVALDVPAAELGCQLTDDVDVLLVPSDLRCFVKCLDGRLCVNPGRLTKGTGGGTYARIAINTSDNTVVAQIVKI